MDKRTREILVAYDKYLYACYFKEPYRTFRRIGRNLPPLFKMLRSEPEPAPCDILFLQYASSISRTQKLRESLVKKGFQVQYETLTGRDVLQKKMFCPPDKTLPVDLIYYDALMKFLIKKYNPKVVCSMMDYSILSVFLKRELQQRGGKYINISHAITDPGHIATMFDFDYYFLFGQSSLQHALRNPIRIGNTKGVLTGSPFITSDFHLPPNREHKNVLFFSQLSFGGNVYSAPYIKPFLEDTHIVIDWARRHPEYHLLIKPRPTGEDVETLQQLIQGISNITLFEASTSMVDALRDASVVLNAASTASVEAAILNRPTVVVNHSGLWSNFLSLENFFLPRATTVEELHQRIVETTERYDEFLQKTQEFVRFHVEYPSTSTDVIASYIESIYHGQENFPYTPISEELTGLQPYMKKRRQR